MKLKFWNASDANVAIAKLCAELGIAAPNHIWNVPKANRKYFELTKQKAAHDAVAASIAKSDADALRRKFGTGTLPATTTTASPPPAPAPAPRFSRHQCVEIMRSVFSENVSPFLSHSDLWEDVSARIAAERLALPGGPAPSTDGLTARAKWFRQQRQDRLDALLKSFRK